MLLSSIPSSSVLGASLLPVAAAASIDSASEDPPVDQSLLAVQVGGIIAGYVIFVAILQFLLLVVGRRLRRRVLSSYYHTSDVELTTAPKSSAKMHGNASPSIKPNGFMKSWNSLTKGAKSHVSNSSDVTFDESVLASDRQKAQEQMEDLYAVVMEHDAKKAAGVNDSTDDFQSSSSPHSSNNNPFGTPASQREGSFVSQEQKQEQKQEMKPPASPRPKTRLSKLSPLALFSSNSRSSEDTERSIRSPRGLSFRKPPISPPAPSPSYSENHQPPTPRVYNPRPPPQAPPAPTSQGKPGRARPAPLNLAPGSRNGSSTKPATSSLPFREAYPPQSAPATKTTIVERPAHLGNGPRTGAPTPYSPYMPFTPVTPITPSRMVTRNQRKREDKGSGLRVLQEDDMVKEDKDMWGY